MTKGAVFSLFGLVLAAGYCIPGWAAGELHLSFHMGGSGGGQSFVGGTLINSGDAPVVHSYVVVTSLDGQCKPTGSMLESFGSIAPGEQLSFRIPVKSGLKRYRLASIKGFDAEGFELLAVDDNARILKGREAQERESCAKAQEIEVP
ncbi:membrane-associated Zn-dependent protease 1 [Pseudomonas sp. P154a]|uniref:FxLYD domain-containing protein n=1 Tax=Pseudomonas mucoides TaxID=2730424 RepID=UPI0018922359|nr:FxLYD domain-containing protein [Pseudomonas mucoides]MBF6037324.1 membrane-associated Zn-dependent protease 1 [Pseudomonas mucoides]